MKIPIEKGSLKFRPLLDTEKKVQQTLLHHLNNSTTEYVNIKRRWLHYFQVSFIPY